MHFRLPGCGTTSEDPQMLVTPELAAERLEKMAANGKLNVLVAERLAIL